MLPLLQVKEGGTPPITPNVEYSSPAGSVASAGMIVWKGRLLGPRQLGWLGSKMKLWPRFWSVKPQPSGTIPTQSRPLFDLHAAIQSQVELKSMPGDFV